MLSVFNLTISRFHEEKTNVGATPTTHIITGYQLNTGQTFQVLRLPWMAEVLEPPGAAPVKTWKVYFGILVPL